jgi:hypothetical protein
VTVVSDGTDATQSGNPSNGTIPNVTNYQVNGADHQQLCISGDAFIKIYEFFTGKAPMHSSPPTASIGSPHEVYGRVLSFIDNEPVADADVVIIWVTWNMDNFGPQTPAVAGPVKTDANGYFHISTLTNVSEMEVRITKTATHYASHVYRQPFLKGTIPFERYYMLPKSGGSQTIQGIRNNLKFSSTHTNVILNTVHKALYDGRDELSAVLLARVALPDEPDSLTIGNSAMLPSPGAGGDISNVTTLVLFDENSNGQSDGGPLNLAPFRTYGVSSSDLFMDASRTQLITGIDINQHRLYFQNWRSSNNDIVWLKFDDLE